jgi:hypothetical protein
MENILSEMAQYRLEVREEYRGLVTKEEFENKCTFKALERVSFYADACDYTPQEAPLQLLFDYEAMTSSLRRR